MTVIGERQAKTLAECAGGVQPGDFSFQVVGARSRRTTEDEPLRAQGDSAVGHLFIQSRGRKMRRRIVAFEGNGDMDAKEREPLFAMLPRAGSGDLNCALKLKNPVSKPA